MNLSNDCVMEQNVPIYVAADYDNPNSHPSECYFTSSLYLTDRCNTLIGSYHRLRNGPNS